MNLLEWADLYGEWDTEPFKRIPKNSLLCEECNEWVSPFDLETRKDETHQYSCCPICDTVLYTEER